MGAPAGELDGRIKPLESMLSRNSRSAFSSVSDIGYIGPRGASCPSSNSILMSNFRCGGSDRASSSEKTSWKSWYSEGRRRASCRRSSSGIESGNDDRGEIRGLATSAAYALMVLAGRHTNIWTPDSSAYSSNSSGVHDWISSVAILDDARTGMEGATSRPSRVVTTLVVDGAIGSSILRLAQSICGLTCQSQGSPRTMAVDWWSCDLTN